MKRIVAVLLSLIFLTGCSAEAVATPSGTTIPVGTVTAEETPSPVPTPSASLITADQMPGFSTNEAPAIAPATINIANLYPGATAEWEILLHNGDGLKNKFMTIETEKDETIAAIPLNVVLANSGLLDVRSIESTLPGEHLEAISYDSSTKLITIKGFKPLAKRTVKITYKTLSVFSTYFRAPNKTKEGFEKAPFLAKAWVTVESPEVLLRPMENGKVKISLTIPKGVELPPKWELWIGVTEQGLGLSGQVTTNIELCERVYITMR